MKKLVLVPLLVSIFFVSCKSRRTFRQGGGDESYYDDEESNEGLNQNNDDDMLYKYRVNCMSDDN